MALCGYSVAPAGGSGLARSSSCLRIECTPQIVRLPTAHRLWVCGPGEREQGPQKQHRCLLMPSCVAVDAVYAVSLSRSVFCLAGLLCSLFFFLRFSARPPGVRVASLSRAHLALSAHSAATTHIARSGARSKTERRAKMHAQPFRKFLQSGGTGRALD